MKKEIVCVEWQDAWAGNRWISDYDHSPLTVYSTGFLLKSDKVGVSLARGLEETEGSILGVSFIPKGMVRKITRIKTIK